jgi:hypothetical protein
MKKLPFIILGIGIVLSVLVVLLVNSKSVIGNTILIDEIKKISEMPYDQYVYDLVTTEDLALLMELTKDDSHARGFLQEAIWLIDHYEPVHVGHALFYLSEYVRTGEDEFCVPHELTHINLYLQHGSIEFAEAQISVLGKYKGEWIDKTERLYERFPQYYKNYDEFMSSVDTVMDRLKNKQYDEETTRLLDFVEQYGVC